MKYFPLIILTLILITSCSKNVPTTPEADLCNAAGQCSWFIEPNSQKLVCLNGQFVSSDYGAATSDGTCDCNLEFNRCVASVVE